MNQVIAIDAKSGTLLWRYRRKRPDGATVPRETNRGIALYGAKVYFAAGEAVLVALDAKTGREVWTTEVADNRSAYYIALAPLIAGGGRISRSWWVRRAESSASAASSRPSIPKRARSCGEPLLCPRRVNPAARLGRRATNGRPAALQCG
jgi:putative pyrroloquinoline-quinone binding quinoprotein